MNVDQMLQGPHAERIATAVVSTTKRVEEYIDRLVAAAVPAASKKAPTPVVPSPAPGALTIAQVRKATGKLLAAKPVPVAPSMYHQPHIEVAIAPLGGGATSKWEEPSAQKTVTATKGSVMIDTGAAVTLVTKCWAEAHGLKVTPPSGVNIRGAAGMAVEVVGLTSMTMQLSPTLEVDVTNVLVSAGEFYQALLGCDLLQGKSGVLGPAIITMKGPNQPGTVQWKQEKVGCIAVATILEDSPTVNNAKGKLPPPPKTKPPAATPPTTLAAEGVNLEAAKRNELAALALEQDQQRQSGTATMEQWRDLLDRAQCLFRACAIPQNISRLLRQIIATKYLRGNLTTESVLARVMSKAQSKGYEAAA